MNFLIFYVLSLFWWFFSPYCSTLFSIKNSTGDGFFGQTDSDLQELQGNPRKSPKNSIIFPVLHFLSLSLFTLSIQLEKKYDGVVFTISWILFKVIFQTNTKFLWLPSVFIQNLQIKICLIRLTSNFPSFR